MLKRLHVMLAVVALCVVSALVITGQRRHVVSTAQPVTPDGHPEQTLAAPAPQADLSARQPTTDADSTLPLPPLSPPRQDPPQRPRKAKRQQTQDAAAVPSPASAKPAAADPGPPPPAVADARIALKAVGLDAEAEVIWLSTINDPAIPADARKDLIEDLNEDGFPDPKHITPDDLPLIFNRIALIEQLGPDAMDGTNAAAFAKAYKDLTQMLDKLARQ